MADVGPQPSPKPTDAKYPIWSECKSLAVDAKVAGSTRLDMSVWISEAGWVEFHLTVWRPAGAAQRSGRVADTFGTVRRNAAEPEKRVIPTLNMDIGGGSRDGDFSGTGYSVDK